MPEELTVAIAALPAVQVAEEVTSAVVSSLYFAVAVNCCFVPTAMLAVAGDTETAVMVFGGGVEEAEVVPPQPMFAISRQEERRKNRRQPYASHEFS
jgi:hypothetical protein